MISVNVEKILNDQIEKEAYSSHLYLAMASWAELSGFQGVSEWFYAQAEEERIHMLKFITYVNERGGKTKIPAIAEPPADFPSVKVLFDHALEHEVFISQSINEIVGVCMDEKDFTSANWIQWFVNEQIEEEATVRSIIDKLNLVGDHNMYLFDADIMKMRGNSSSSAAPSA